MNGLNEGGREGQCQKRVTVDCRTLEKSMQSEFYKVLIETKEFRLDHKRNPTNRDVDEQDSKLLDILLLQTNEFWL